MKRLTFEGNFCDIAQCKNTPGGSFCEDGYCSQRRVWERLKEYEDTALPPHETERIKSIIKTLNKNKYASVDVKFAGHIIKTAEAALKVNSAGSGREDALGRAAKEGGNDD